MNVRRCLGSDNCKLPDVILAFCNLESPRIIACHTDLNRKQLLNSYTYNFIFDSEDHNKSLAHLTESQIWTEKARTKQD